MAATHRRDWIWGWGDNADESEQQALTIAQKAVELDRLLPHSHKELASIYVYRRRYDEAIDEALKAVDLDPNGADGYVVLAEVLNYAGQSTEAIKNVQAAMRLDPYHSAWYPYIIGQAYYLRGEYQEAEKALMSSFNRNPKFMPARAYRAAVYWELGGTDKAAAEIGEIGKVIPNPPTQRKGTTPFKDLAIRQRLHDTWAKAEEAWRQADTAKQQGK